MPLTLNNLDDRTFDDLVEEGLALIQSGCSKWTNHNPSDPGIALIEVFAYLTEILLYRLNRISDENLYAFLRLLNGPEWKPSKGKSLKDEIRETVCDLREPWRAVTHADFEMLALKLIGNSTVARAHCISSSDVTKNKPATYTSGAVKLVVIIKNGGNSLSPSPELRKRVEDYLKPRMLLTTRLNVIGPRCVKMDLRFNLHLFKGAVPGTVIDNAKEALLERLHPFRGGPEGEGWPLGAYVYTSELYSVLDHIPGVDWVERYAKSDEIEVKENRNRIKRTEDNRVAYATLEPNELPDVCHERIHLDWTFK